jgi:PAS domain S-box-containing protein
MDTTDIFAEAFENSRYGALLLEKATGRVMEVNSAFLRICGRPRGEVVGRSFWAPPLIDDAEAGAEVFAHLCAGGIVEAAELPLAARDGSRRLLEVSGRELAGGVVHVEVQDVTARAGARIAERMDAQRGLAARVAGEFGEMRRALQAAGEMLAQCAKRGQATFIESDEVRKAADSAGAIARELQAYAGQLEFETGRVQLNELIEDMRPVLQQMLGRGVEFVADLSRDASPVMADPAQVRQILLKLAANSGEAMQHSGRFRVATRNAPTGDPTLERAGDICSFAMLEVSDQGPGFDDESWEHLYEPFFTTKRNGKRGMGLAAVHGIVHRMGGRLWARSEPGKGAWFRIYLPLAQTESVAAPAPAADRRSPATILLMEQNDGLRNVVTNILKKRGYRVLAARGASDALEMATAQGPPDLLIGEREPLLAKHLASLQPELPTLALRGDSLGRPFELDMLLGKVRELLQV